MRYEDARALIQHEAAFVPFRDMFLHEPLLRFIHAEKCRFSRQVEDRLTLDVNGRENGGYRVDTSMPDDDYQPHHFLPFMLDGIWLPVKQGHFFSTETMESLLDCPLLKRDEQDEEHVLFLIHPQSRSLYRELLEQHASHVIQIPALSLSSLRSLLIAVPDKSTPGQFIPAMVKVSLDQYTQGVHRILKTRECALSIANTAMFREKLRRATPSIPLSIMEEQWAYVHKNYQHGMLFRKLPECLNPRFSNPSGAYLVPMLALYGQKNQAFFQQLMHANGGSIASFLGEKLLKPFVHIFIRLLHDHQLSIEAHGQNLLLKLDQNYHVLGLVYRDMGGVNQLLTDEELLTLPANLQDKSLYYFPQHQHDAAKALEDHFVRRGLFPLTKQCCKSAHLMQDDVAFQAWFSYVKERDYLSNWTTEDIHSDEHRVYLRKDQFYRYGYVESLFANEVLAYLRDSYLVNHTTFQQYERHFHSSEQAPDGRAFAPCTHRVFFEKVVLHSVHRQALSQQAASLNMAPLRTEPKDPHTSSRTRLSMCLAFLTWLSRMIQEWLARTASYVTSRCRFFNASISKTKMNDAPEVLSDKDVIYGV